MEKKIFKVYNIPPIQWVGDGFRVYHYIPTHELTMQMMDPFIMLDYHPEHQYLPNKQKPSGVDVHPHKGFETVTIVYQGALEHVDNSGGGGAIYAGDVQWMTAGSGILHKELHEKNFSLKGGKLQLVQLWINLPAQFKYVPPKYQTIKNQKIPKYLIENHTGFIEVIAGRFQEIVGPAQTYSPIQLMNIFIENQANIKILLEDGFTTALLVIQGKIEIQAQYIHSDKLVVLERRGDELKMKAHEKSIVLLMSGKPLNEPIVAYGPFVMNTPSEIYQTIKDYQEGKFGSL